MNGSAWLLAGGIAGAIGLLVAAGWLLHRLCLKLEQWGYLYYRQRPTGSSAGVFLEMDRLVRPSIQHIVEAEDLDTQKLERKTGAP